MPRSFPTRLSSVHSDSEPVRELVMLPGTAPRFLRLPGEPARYVALETLLARFSALIFQGYRVKAAAAFRVLRDSDIEKIGRALVCTPVTNAHLVCRLLLATNNQ